MPAVKTLALEFSFEEKWSKEILAHGFTAIPNLLLLHRKELGISVAELHVLITIESFRWNSRRDPWPSLDKLSEWSGYTPRNLSRIITSLEKKYLLKRIKRKGTSNAYSLAPLVDELNGLAKLSPTKAISGTKHKKIWVV